MNKITLLVATIGLAIGWTLAFAQVNPSSPPTPQSMHQAVPAKPDGSNAGNKTVTALHDLKTNVLRASSNPRRHDLGTVTAAVPTVAPVAGRSTTRATAKVKAALLGDQLTMHSHIHVSTADGVVTLSGTTAAPAAR